MEACRGQEPVSPVGSCIAGCLGVDLLFWRKPRAFPLPSSWRPVCLAGFAAAYGKGAAPGRASLLLLLPLGFFAVMSAIRQEAFTAA
jgi:hypothetical protein